jgi:hypothetical protein
MKNQGVFTIKDREFMVDQATFGIHVDLLGTITWSIDITTLPVNDVHVTWQPHLSAEITNPPISQPYSWQQFVLALPDAYDEETDEYPANLYVFGHHHVYDSRITITREHGNLYSIAWRGMGDVHYDEHYDTGLALTIDSPIRFEGIQTAEHDEEQARTQIGGMVGGEPMIAVKTKQGVAFLLAPQSTKRRT